MLCLLAVYLSPGQVPTSQQSWAGPGTFEGCVQGSVRGIAGVIGDMFYRSEIKAKPAFG